MIDCIFCKIIKNDEADKTVIFENDTVIAIKPKTEISPGHTLIIPKDHYENIFDIPADILSEIAKVSQNLAISLKEKYKAKGMNLLHASGKDAGQSVFHFHMHIVPRFADDGLDLWLKKNL